MKKDTLGTRKRLNIGKKEYSYYSIAEAGKKIGLDFVTLPYSLKIVLENLLRFEDGKNVTIDDIKAVGKWLKDKKSNREITFRPARVLMQDFTGVPAIVDLAAMRDAIKSLGGDPAKINPLTQVDLVIDHSIEVEHFATNKAFEQNVKSEMSRNRERYEFLRWGQSAFNNFRVVPPGTGICHQVNLEYLAKVIWTKKENGQTVACPDTLVGTDSHTTMVNGLGVLGWGVGGIEAEAAMLGQPISMVLPEVVGVRITGAMSEGVTATDAVLTITQILRKKGVVGKFVEFFGPSLGHLSLADRATLANMAPEYGATCGIFPIDEETIKYMKLTARPDELIDLAEAYARAQGMWHDENSPEPVFSSVVEFNLSTIVPCIAGPKRPQDKVALGNAPKSFAEAFPEAKIEDATKITNGAVVIAAITSCTNTSNPSVMIAAGLLAKKAFEFGLRPKQWVKTSLAPGSQVVTEYLTKSGLQEFLDKLGFNLVGYGCTTCIGNSGPLYDITTKDIKSNDLTVCSVLSGNRNFEGRIHPLVKANYLASPPLVVAYALAGNININLDKDPIGKNKQGENVYLSDIWPSNKEISDVINSSLTSKIFAEKYANVFAGTKEWQDIGFSQEKTYDWKFSTYIKKPPYFDDIQRKTPKTSNINGANILALLGDSITTDHISPAGNIHENTPAALYLKEHNFLENEYNSYGSRRGNDDVMVRGTFANIRLQNEMVPDKTGGYTIYLPDDEIMNIFSAAMKYKKTATPLVVIGGKDYGMGSSRDWAAKGTLLLGVKAVIAESFERIHRSNLVGMGILPLTFKSGENRKTLKLDGTEKISISGLEKGIKAGMQLECKIDHTNGKSETIKIICKIDTAEEVDYFINGGILQKVVRDLAS
jgi:aconitate hydratase